MKHRKTLAIFRNFLLIIICLYFCNTFKNIVRFRNINNIESIILKKNNEEKYEISENTYIINKTDWNILLRFLNNSIFNNGQYSIFNIFGTINKVIEPPYTINIKYKHSRRTTNIEIWDGKYFRINGYWQYHMGNEKVLLKLLEEYVN